jgi:4-hydroxyphenylpyruvate dioxygenase-like putative hemolysin
MAKANKTPAVRTSLVTKNPDSVKFAEAPFYNLANVRQATKQLIVRSSQDPKKVAAILETLEVLTEFLTVRAKHGVEVRAATVAANDAAAAAAQAKHDGAALVAAHAGFEAATAAADVHGATIRALTPATD